MEDKARAAKATDPIDRFAEEILRHPDRAEDLKRALRDSMGRGAVHRIQPDRRPLAEDEPDELWDNVPV